MAKLKLGKFFPATIDIDGETIRLQLRRMELDEFTQFERHFFEYGTPDPGVTIAVEGEENMTIEQILLARGRAAQERLERQTPEEREAEQRRVVEKAERLTSWIQEQIELNVSLPEGEIEDGDDQPVTTGARFLQLFGGRYPLLMQVINLIWASNRLPEDVKKKVLSPSDSPAT